MKKLSKALSNKINSIGFLDDDERESLMLFTTVLRERANKIEGMVTKND